MTQAFDKTILDKVVIDVLQNTFSRIPGLTSLAPETKTGDIEDYEGRMKVSSVGRLDSPAYISTVNLFPMSAEVTKEKLAKGTFIILVNSESAGKLLKGLGYKVPDDEDDASMMALCSEFTEKIADEVAKKLSSQGMGLKIGGMQQYRNSAMHGVAYSSDQKNKQEYTFFIGRSKLMIVEVVLSGK